VSSFGLNQIVLAPRQRGRIHRHRGQEEVYVVLSGTLTLVIEEEPHDYPTGAVVRVGPEIRRQLVNRHREPVSLLALGGVVDHEHEGRDGEAFERWEDTTPGTPQTVPMPEDLPDSELV
jgi:quercetin dioxygenase-like cupin family protein